MSRKTRFLTVSLLFVTAAVLVASLLAQVRLTQISDEYAALREKYAELCTENTRLTVEYESAVSLPEVEEYAKTVLGMQRQTNTVPAARDKAEILKKPAETDAEKLVSSIKEYLFDFGCKFN